MFWITLLTSQAQGQLVNTVTMENVNMENVNCQQLFLVSFF